MTGETFHDAFARQMVLEVFMREHEDGALVFAYDDDRDPIVCRDLAAMREASETDWTDIRSIPNAAGMSDELVILDAQANDYGEPCDPLRD